MKDWNVLKDREIIDLMIGDSMVKSDYLYDYTMPKMSGPKICEFGSLFGVDRDYWSDEKKSRWMYMEDIIDYVIKKNMVNLFFKELLNLKRFRKVCMEERYKDSNQVYWDYVYGFLKRTNEILFFEKCHIEYDLERWKFSIIDDEDKIIIESENIEKVGNDYIKELKNGIFDTIKNEDYNSCITKSRTLIEEVLIYGIEQKNEIVEAKGDINKLYAKFKTLYNMHQSQSIDKRINNLLSGFEKIITSISSMRDENSDSHGRGAKRIKLEKHHVLLFANASITMSEFLLSVVENNKKSN